ncbi:YncE family protein [Prevotella nigrescens]|uniref:YncE family protein n=1 Tax=Prevotella nigrescens TaxID=28133 RepID=UPI0036148309
MKHYFLIAALVLLSLVGLTSCGKDSPDFPPSTKSEVGFVHSVNIGENTYISLFKDLSVSSLNTDNALVLPKGAFTFVYKNKIYVTDTEHLYKYIPKDGILVQEGNTMLFPSGAKATYITFLSEKKAYVSCLGLGKVWIIDPSSMTKTGEIDLSGYSLGKLAGDNNPEPCASIIRDGILYVTLCQLKSAYSCEKGAHIALIDTKTDKPIKMISDPRATMASSMTPAGDPFVDEKGDIYFYCVAMFGYQPGVKEGFLRIKKGEQDFDNSYCFTLADVNLEGVKGNRTSYAYNKVYGGNGNVYGYLSIPGATSNPPDYVHDKSFQAFEINLYNKTCKKMNFSGTVGWATSICKSGNNIIFGMSTDQGTGYSVYHMDDGSYEKLKVKVSGAPYMLHELK